jgi:hypothetical protein
MSSEAIDIIIIFFAPIIFTAVVIAIVAIFLDEKP